MIRIEVTSDQWQVTSLRQGYALAGERGARSAAATSLSRDVVEHRVGRVADVIIIVADER